MSESEYLTDLIKGAELSKNNAERLLQDAKVLFNNQKWNGSFVLSTLSLEEQAKAFKLINKYAKGKRFSKKEWKDFAISHNKKLAYIEKTVDRLDARKVREQTGIDFWGVLKKTYQNAGAKSLEDYRKRFSKELESFRVQTLYIDYDFKNKKWLENAQVSMGFCLNRKRTAEELLALLNNWILKIEGDVRNE